MESLVPPGFRFHPTDEELVGYYLKKKVASQKIDLDVIRDIDLYRIEPWDLQERCRIGYEEQKEWYFFSHKDKKYPTGTRTNRATMAGFWKATGRDKAVYDKIKLIGMRKTLVFYKGRAPNGQKSDWIIHEYRLESDENGAPQEEGWVVCRAFKKRTTTNCQTRNHTDRRWESSSRPYDHESSGFSSILDSVGCITKQQNYICKQEIHEVNLNLDSNFLELIPQLESPSMPVVKKHPLTSLLSSRCPTEPVAIIVIDEDHEEDTTRIRGYNSDDKNNNKMKHGSTEQKVTDWRALDKFVASQLSHGDNKNRSHDSGTRPNLGVALGDDQYNSDIALLLSRKENNEINKLKEFLLSSSASASGDDCDNIIGICI